MTPNGGKTLPTPEVATGSSRTGNAAGAREMVNSGSCSKPSQVLRSGSALHRRIDRFGRDRRRLWRHLPSAVALSPGVRTQASALIAKMLVSDVLVHSHV